MQKELKIGVKTINLLSNGITPIVYKQLFTGDLMQLISEGEGIKVADEKAPELAFVMAKQAEGLSPAELMTLNRDMYYEWLMQFEPLDLTMAGAEIVNLYISTSMPTSEPKKKANGGRKG